MAEKLTHYGVLELNSAGRRMREEVRQDCPFAIDGGLFGALLGTQDEVLAWVSKTNRYLEDLPRRYQQGDPLVTEPAAVWAAVTYATIYSRKYWEQNAAFKHGGTPPDKKAEKETT